MATSFSALESLLREEGATDDSYPDHLNHLTKQVLHNLQYQHRWIDLEIHASAPGSGRPFPRPLISGLPPKRLYMHPDEQADLLKKQSRHQNASSSAIKGGRDGQANPLEAPVTEWVLPTHLREKWTLRQFAEVFNSMDEKTASGEPPWDAHKRVVLATLQDDSTIVYYVR